MAMTKKDFIALADAIRAHDSFAGVGTDNQFTDFQLETLADFWQSQNSQFMRARWLAYIAGKCGKNGGKVTASSLPKEEWEPKPYQLRWPGYKTATD